MSSSPEQTLRNRIDWNEGQAQKFTDRADKFRAELAAVVAARTVEHEEDLPSRAHVRVRATRSGVSVSSDGG